MNVLYGGTQKKVSEILKKVGDNQGKPLLILRRFNIPGGLGISYGLTQYEAGIIDSPAQIIDFKYMPVIKVASEGSPERVFYSAEGRYMVPVRNMLEGILAGPSFRSEDVASSKSGEILIDERGVGCPNMPPLAGFFIEVGEYNIERALSNSGFWANISNYGEFLKLLTGDGLKIRDSELF